MVRGEESMKRTGIFCWLSAVLCFAACSEQVVVQQQQGACGNGELELGEACDDGNETNSDDCTNGCDLARCGDGVTRTDLPVGEAGHELR